MIVNNVVFLTSVVSDEPCSLLINLETPNDVQSVALHSYNIQATSKGSEAMLFAHTKLLEISCHGSFVQYLLGRSCLLCSNL